MSSFAFTGVWHANPQSIVPVLLGENLSDARS